MVQKRIKEKLEAIEQEIINLKSSVDKLPIGCGNAIKVNIDIIG